LNCPLCGKPNGGGNAYNRSAKCRDCYNVMQTDYRIRKYGSIRSYNLQRRYGISEAEYDARFAEQGGLCALCRKQPALVVDHDHETGAIRGLLCQQCNRGLGFLGDTIETLLKAVEYLQRAAAKRAA
jgi:hypothetical protein